MKFRTNYLSGIMLAVLVASHSQWAVEKPDKYLIARAWESVADQHTNRLTQKSEIRGEKLEWFLGYIEGRLLVTPPTYWSDAIRTAKYCNNAGSGKICFSNDDRNWPYHVSKSGLLCPRNTQITLVDDVWQVEVDGKTMILPNSLKSLASESGGCISVFISDERNYVAIHSQPRSSFDLNCLSNNGEIIWKGKVTAGQFDNFRKFGSHFHHVQIVARDKEVFVFGYGVFSAYIERFGKADGKKTLEFMTGKEYPF